MAADTLLYFCKRLWGQSIVGAIFALLLHRWLLLRPEAGGVEQRQKARLVCVAANSIETARLLLLSESAKFPHGLANSTDQVGRNYCRHTAGFIWGVFDKPIHFWRGTTLAGIVEELRSALPFRDSNVVHFGTKRCPAGWTAYEDLVAGARSSA